MIEPLKSLKEKIREEEAEEARLKAEESRKRKEERAKRVKGGRK